MSAEPSSIDSTSLAADRRHSSNIISIRRTVRNSFKKVLGAFREEHDTKGTILKEASLYTCFGLAGWVDATPGALLPAIRASYKLGFAVVSMLFIGNLAGCVISSFLTSPSVDKIGYGKTISIAALLGAIFPIVFLTLPPFPVLVVGMAFSGLSNGMFEALVNVWLARRPRAHLRLGLAHFLYGVGALSSPLAAIPFVHEGRRGPAFQHFYFVSLGLALVTCGLVSVAFKLQREDIVEGMHEDEPVRDTLETFELQTKNDASVDDAGTVGASTPAATNTVAEFIPSPQPRTTLSATQKLKKVISMKIVHVLSVFIMVYVGTEVTVGGWTSTFLIEVRNESTNANILVSGFWAGIALGRLLLIPLTSKIGEEVAVFLYLCLAVGLQLLLWLVPNIVANAVALALLGLFLGPVFPIMINCCSRWIRPRAYLTPAISFMTTFASIGAALLPLTVGLASQASSSGILILAPILLGLLSLQALIWAYLNQAVFIAMITRRRSASSATNDTDRVD